MIDNSECQLSGFTREQFSALRKILSYTADPSSAFFSGGFPQRRYLIAKDGKFPSGLLYLVIGYLEKSQYVYTTKDVRVKPKSKPGMFKLSLK